MGGADESRGCKATGLGQRAPASWVRAPPRAGSVAFPRWLPGGTAFAERAAHTAGLVIVPSSLFARGDAHVRLGLGRTSFGASLGVPERELARLL